MRQEFFGRTASTFGGAFSADDALMTFPAITSPNGTAQRAEVPLLLQQAGFNYQQQITRLYELTSNAVYYVAGRAQGTGQLNQVLGPVKLSQNFLRTYGAVCRAGTNVLHFSMAAGCRQASPGQGGAGVGIAGGRNWQDVHAFSANFVVLTSIALQIAAESMLIQQNIGMTIGTLEYEDAGVASANTQNVGAVGGAAGGGGILGAIGTAIGNVAGGIGGTLPAVF